MDTHELITQLRREIKGLRKSLVFWAAQPDALGISGLNVEQHRDGLRANIRELKNALSILTGSPKGKGLRGEKRPADG